MRKAPEYLDDRDICRCSGKPCGLSASQVLSNKTKPDHWPKTSNKNQEKCGRGLDRYGTYQFTTDTQPEEEFDRPWPSGLHGYFRCRPLTGIAGAIPIAMLLGNGAGIPGTFVLMAIIMAIWAVGFVALARHVRNAGAFYAYSARALGGRIGGAIALIAVLAYNAMMFGLLGLLGGAASGIFGQFGINLPLVGMEPDCNSIDRYPRLQGSRVVSKDPDGSGLAGSVDRADRGLCNYQQGRRGRSDLQYP